jgi:hypothetical protein
MRREAALERVDPASSNPFAPRGLTCPDAPPYHPPAVPLEDRTEGCALDGRADRAAPYPTRRRNA